MSSTCFETCYVPCGCKAILSEKDSRADLWKVVLGCLEFPLVQPLSHLAQDEKGELCRFLQGDWKALSVDQQRILKDELKKRFGLPGDSFFYAQIKQIGYIPIKDENISVAFCQRHSRMVMSP